MRILNFGSLNLDRTYRVPHIAAPGETMTSQSLEIRPGGKGLNQSVALARAGAEVFHAGLVGVDGDLLRAVCEESGVDTRFICTSDVRSGNAIIQVDGRLRKCDLEKVWLFILNEVEGEQLSGEKDPDGILRVMRQMYPQAEIVLTLGAQGSLYCNGEWTVRQEIFPVETVDTTGAGDTFTGYFITEYLDSGDPAKALRTAAMASAIAVSAKGAADAVPEIGEVQRRLEEQERYETKR